MRTPSPEDSAAETAPGTTPLPPRRSPPKATSSIRSKPSSRRRRLRPSRICGRGGADGVRPACRNAGSADRRGNGAGRGHRDAGLRSPSTTAETAAVEVADAGAEPPPLSAEPEPETRRGGADDVHPACRNAGSADRLGNGAGRGHRDAGRRVPSTKGKRPPSRSPRRPRSRRRRRTNGSRCGALRRVVARSPRRGQFQPRRPARVKLRGRPTSPGPTPPLAARRGAAPRGFRPRRCARRDAGARRRRDARSGGERRTARSFPTRWRSATSS